MYIHKKKVLYFLFTCKFLLILCIFQVAAPDIAMIKVAAPNMALKVIDRAIQVNLCQTPSGSVLWNEATRPHIVCASLGAYGWPRPCKHDWDYLSLSSSKLLHASHMR